MLKKITITFVLIAVILSGVYAVVLLRTRQANIGSVPTESTTPTDQKGLGGAQMTSDGTGFLLSTSSSETPLLVPNFFSQATGVEPQAVYADETTGSKTGVLASTETYSLYAFSGTDGASFMISIYGANLRQARVDGERAMLDLLHVTEAQACSMPLRVAVDPAYSNVVNVDDVRPSFCADRVDLPTATTLELEGSNNSGDAIIESDNNTFKL